ncbi:MAG: zf-TFIIB domain-containing protein [Micropruina sp.]|uniref:TFIIB-type zinc ribbon-containing protein n=1 Tax=Micropruina sp. TaxID=2737536 RepID=UPI0039E25803
MSSPTDPMPRYEPYAGAVPAGFTCPKCAGSMRTVDRNGIHIEQCLNCRGVFLDFGELENITQLEARFAAPPPPAQSYGYGPDWGHRGGHRYRRGGLGGLFFSS